jgi:hypothetical protein
MNGWAALDRFRGCRLGNVPFWPAAGCHGQAGATDRVAGASTTVRSGKSKIPNGRWCYGLSLVIPAVPSTVLRVE